MMKTLTNHITLIIWNYLNDIEPSIETLRADYPEDNSFKSYLNVLTVITSHLPSLQDNYQTLTKLNINVYKALKFYKMKIN